VNREEPNKAFFTYDVLINDFKNDQCEKILAILKANNSENKDQIGEVSRNNLPIKLSQNISLE